MRRPLSATAPVTSARSTFGRPASRRANSDCSRSVRVSPSTASMASVRAPTAATNRHSTRPNISFWPTHLTPCSLGPPLKTSGDVRAPKESPEISTDTQSRKPVLDQEPDASAAVVEDAQPEDQDVLDQPIVVDDLD